MAPYLYCENNQVVVLLQSVYVITNHCRVLIVIVAPIYSDPLLAFVLSVSFKKLKKLSLISQKPLLQDTFYSLLFKLL